LIFRLFVFYNFPQKLQKAPNSNESVTKIVFLATFPDVSCLICQVYTNNDNNITDQLLVGKVLSGDTGAFKLIMKNTEGLVVQIVFKMIPGSEDRKDIAQDIYLKAFQKLQKFRFQSKLSTWIGQIAYNTCINYLQKKKLVLLDDNKPGDEEFSGSSTSQFSNDTEKIIFKKELSAILKIEIDKLPPVYKTLITLYHMEELSYSEIAEISELPIGTVKNYLFRARKILKDNLWHSCKIHCYDK
jgi:RNA polymerase sigma-70 factor (ECF subfamily)